jgi:glutamate/tyrosine decarboxylase-like PLP-dependent enzyme
MERRVITWLNERLGFPAEATGNFTSGGSEANATALLVALVRANPAFADEGLASFAGAPCFYASADSHLAWIKIARAAGLGRNAVRLVSTSGDGRLDPQALRRMLIADREAGRRPVMVVATAGTTNAGEIDPMADCRALADEFGLHLHVDAAWAGGLILDPERRGLLDGIEHADSVTIDAHKWLSVPMGAGMILVRDARAVAQAFAVTTGYMPAGDGADAYVTTSQWSRRFLGLRLWLMLRATGSAAYQAMFARQFALAAYLRERLVERGWRIHNRSPLPVVLFGDAEDRFSSRELADALEADGQTWLGCVDYEGRTLLRACVTSFLSEHEDVELLLERLDVVRGSAGSR